MECPDESELLGFLGGRLAREPARAMEIHFDECDSCRQLAFALATGGHADDAGDAGAHAIDAGATIGRFVIAESIAQGAMGIIYRAHDPSLRRDVALKLVRVAPVPLADRASESAEVAQSLLVREAQGLAQLKHPNVVTVFEVGTHEGEVFIAMELVEGDSLDRWLERAPRTWRQIAKVLEHAGRGLAAAHAAGLVHRDVKPANVMIANDGTVKVVDFGLARGVSERVSSTKLDALSLQQLALTGKVVGTPAYCAPEQLVGGDVDPSSDVFSFCVTCCEALLGRRPYLATTAAGLLERMREGPELPARPRLPAKLRQVLRQGLAMERAQRLSSIDPIVDELAAAPSRFRTRAIIASVAVVVVAAPLATLALASSASSDDPCAGTSEPLPGGYTPADDPAIRAGSRTPGSRSRSPRRIARSRRSANGAAVPARCARTRVERRASSAPSRRSCSTCA